MPAGAHRGMVVGLPCRCGTRRGACPVGRLPTLPSRQPAGGLAFFAACRPCQSGTRRGAVPCLPCFSCHIIDFLPQSPRPPSPPGKGEIFTLFRRGLRPRHPGVKPLAALTVSAVHVPGGGAYPVGRRLTLPSRHPQGGLPPAALAIPAPGERTISNAEVPLPRSPLSLAAGTSRGKAVLSVLRRVGDSEGTPPPGTGTAGAAGGKEGKPPPGTTAERSAGNQPGQAPAGRVVRPLSQCRLGSAPGMQGAKPLA